MVLSLMAGREEGQGKRARTPGSPTELKKAYLDLTSNFF